MFDPIKQYFDLEELACPHTFKQFGSMAWDFFDDSTLETLYVIRRGIGVPFFVNNWAIGGNLSQRGLRCNVCPLVKEKTALEKVYMTAHGPGKAVDFTAKGMTANEVRLWIVENQVLLPYNIRLEVGFNPRGMTDEQIRAAIASDTMSWVHFDLRAPKSQKVTFFQG